VPVDERDVGAGPKQLERRLGRRIPAAHHGHAQPVERVRFAVVVVNMRKIFAGDIQQVRMIVIADRKHDVACVTNPPHSAA